MRKRYTTLSFLVIVTSCLILAPIVSAQTGFTYAFISVSGEGQIQLQKMKLTNDDFSIETGDLLTSNNWQPPLIMSTVSPNGEWITLVQFANDNRSVLIRLLSVISGETHDINLDSLAGRPTGFVGSDQNLAWSLDSRYLALNGTQGGDDLEIYIFTIEDSLLTNLTNDEANQFLVAWSHDSKRIVTVTDDRTDLTDVSTCIHQPEVIDVVNNVSEASVDLSHLSLGPLATGTNSCEFSWSPDGQVVSFAASCNALASMPHIKEVYLWDLGQGTVIPVTQFTLEAGTQEESSYLGGVYRTIWYDSHTLLIGAEYILGPNMLENTQTIAYDLAKGTNSLLFTQMVDQWAINSITNDIAVHLAAPSTNTQLEETQLNNSSVQIFTLNSDNNVISRFEADSNTLPPGCRLNWSPDGTVLAYVTTISGNCLDTIESIVFIDATSGAVQQYTPPLEEGAIIVPIGWIVG